jgi:hypothetical protein
MAMIGLEEAYMNIRRGAETWMVVSIRKAGNEGTFFVISNCRCICWYSSGYS